jgi:hypothetical protein
MKVGLGANPPRIRRKLNLLNHLAEIRFRDVSMLIVVSIFTKRPTCDSFGVQNLGELRRGACPLAKSDFSTIVSQIKLLLALLPQTSD